MSMDIIVDFGSISQKLYIGFIDHGKHTRKRITRDDHWLADPAMLNGGKAIDRLEDRSQ